MPVPSRRIRRSTLCLVVAILALACALVLQQRKEGRLRGALTLYKSRSHERVVDRLRSGAPTLDWPDGTPLTGVIEQIKLCTQSGWPRFPLGVPIAVDPVGLQQAGQSFNRPPSADTLTLGEHLSHILDRLELAYVVRDGFLMVTSKGSLDVETGDAVNPYLHYRDVLR
jgi:hypothetical protein